MPWAVAAAGITAAAGLGGAAMQSSATSNAANLSRNDSRVAYLMEDANLAPYRKAGEDALHQIEGLTQGGWSGYQDALDAGFRTDPGYQFRFNEGQRAVDASAAAAHMLNGGAAVKAAERYGQGVADQYYGQYADRFNNYVNRLFALTELGQNSAAKTGAAGLQTAQDMGKTAVSAGNTQANIFGNTSQGISDTVNSLLQNKNFQSWINPGSGGTSIYSSTPNLIWNPNNPVGTSTLGGSTANQGWWANNFG